MNLTTLLLAGALGALSLTAQAQPAVPAEHDHDHGAPPAAASRAVPAARPAPDPARVGAGLPDAAPRHVKAIDDQIAALRALHERLQAVSDPYARRALLTEQRARIEQALALASAASPPMRMPDREADRTDAGAAPINPMHRPTAPVAGTPAAGMMCGAAAGTSGATGTSAGCPMMRDAMRPSAGMAETPMPGGMMAMHQAMERRMTLLQLSVQALLDQIAVLEPRR